MLILNEAFSNINYFYVLLFIIWVQCFAVILERSVFYFRYFNHSDAVPFVRIARISGMKYNEKRLLTDKGYKEREVISREIDRGLWFLSLSSQLGPSIGLIGTIWGISVAFRGSLSDPTLMHSAFSTALGTTLWGSWLFVVSITTYYYFLKKTETIKSALGLGVQNEV
jgi:biopolymer transport protein ExbB/TolQ